LRLTVLRSGIPDHIPGRTVEIGEGGLGVVLASQLLLGESVRVEFLLPHTNMPVRATAVVRYENNLCHGLQFLRLPAEQESVIRYWTRREGSLSLATGREPAQDERSQFDGVSGSVGEQVTKTKSRGTHLLGVAAVIMVVATAVQWSYWEREWKVIEGDRVAVDAPVPRAQVQLPREVIARRLVHKVPAIYPEQARAARVEGTVVLAIVVNADGRVSQMNVLSGPEVLAAAAMDAVRWWRYEPYSLGGQAVAVESSVALEFRL
jgi:TonB family protein